MTSFWCLPFRLITMLNSISLRLLRLLVVALVALMIMKFLFWRTENDGSSRASFKFWKDDNSPGTELGLRQENEFLSAESKADLSLKRTTNKAAVKKASNGVKKLVDRPLTNKSPQRMVHLDLKGAAPNLKYLQEIFPLFSTLGADGILIEYEDMFPYVGELKIVRSPFAYSAGDIEEIKRLAKLNNLELIPLVQIFGHLEFVLKHEKFFHLREVQNFPQSLNPHVPGSMEIVTEMLTQVMKVHPEAQWIHIGADEVYNLGESQDSKNWLDNHNGDIGMMFLNHVSVVAKFIKEKRSKLNLLMWDDMLRKISSATIKESGLPALVSPVIWSYVPELHTDIIASWITNYQKAGFQDIWFASAFKGASGIDRRWTPLQHHLQNHLSWIKVMSNMTKFSSIHLQGFILTGWQRYGHHTVLCELLPVAIPSLAICLQTLKHGSFNKEAREEANLKLGCIIHLNKDLCEGETAFSGAQLYHMVHHIHSKFYREVEKATTDRLIRGTFSRYNRKYNYANPRYVGFFKDNLQMVLDGWTVYMESFRAQMEAIFFPDTVEEWMEENVNYQLELLHDLVEDAERIMKLNGQPKSLKTK
ncbi:hexosaminidase D [Denticeps clupeoides]|uniref:hexosaminidase D n=1 Tax=Denticeps clupeoides TaxID=299321 RepID=UPI0010A53BB5|nr:hexosaminidase D-like [Denticeps clupeoides]